MIYGEVGYGVFDLEDTVVIRKLRPKFKFPAKIVLAFFQILAIR